MTIVMPKCATCLLYLGGRSCIAFPKDDEIPDEIWSGENDHSKPVKGDHGFQYRPLEDAEDLT
jgi:hypothetical protein